MKINAISFAGYQKPAMREVQKENCTSFILEGYDLKKPFAQVDCYDKGVVIKSEDQICNILVRRPELENMAQIMSSTKLTDAQCQGVIDKYSA